MSPIVLKVLKHYAILAGLGAAGAIAVGLLTFLNGFNIAVLPVTYQLLAGVLIPLIIAAIKNAQTEIANELAAEQAKKDIAAAQAQVVSAQSIASNATAKLAELTKSINSNADLKKGN